jgi:hypothetical protein
MKLSPYHERLLSKSVTETRRFWNAYRTSTTIASPIAAALLWAVFRGWKGWADMFFTLLLAAGLFFSGWGIAFFVSLFYYAPELLDTERQAEIEKLATGHQAEIAKQAADHQANIASLNVEWNRKIAESQAQTSQQQAKIGDLEKNLAIPDQAVTAHVRELLAKTSDKGKSFLRIAALRDVFEPRQLNVKDLRSDEIMTVARECEKAGLLTIDWVDDRRGGGKFDCRVPHDFRNVITRLLNS